MARSEERASGPTTHPATPSGLRPSPSPSVCERRATQPAGIDRVGEGELCSPEPIAGSAEPSPGFRNRPATHLLELSLSGD